MTVVLVLITVTTISARVGSLERDGLPDELQQIGFCPAPCLELLSKQGGNCSLVEFAILLHRRDLEGNRYTCIYIL